MSSFSFFVQYNMQSDSEQYVNIEETHKKKVQMDWSGSNESMAIYKRDNSLEDLQI